MPGTSAAIQGADDGRKPELRAAEEGGQGRRHRHRARLRWSTCRAGWSASASRPSISSTARYDETHGCNYLLANDIDMEPVPGYKAASWEKGYGDFVMKPDLSTLRAHAVAGRHGAGAVRRARPSTIRTCRIRRARC